MLRANEAERVSRGGDFQRRGLIGGGVTVAVAASSCGMWAREGDPRLRPCGDLAASWGSAFTPITRSGNVAERLKRGLLRRHRRCDGRGVQAGGFEPPAFDRIKRPRLLPSYEPLPLRGSASRARTRNCRFDLYEGHLEQRHTDSKGRTRYSTVFRGQLIRMHFPREFLGVTVVRRDAGVFNAFGGGNVAAAGARAARRSGVRESVRSVGQRSGGGALSPASR